MAEIKLKAKYTRRKISKNMSRTKGGNSNTPRKRVPGPKTYVYGSRVMVVDALRGTARMRPGK